MITLVLFAAISSYREDGDFNAGTVFTSTAILAMVTHPANMVMTIIPRAIASLANFERIQKYLLESTRVDPRSHLEQEGTNSSPTRINKKETPAIIFSNVSLQYTEASYSILHDVNTSIDTGSIVICSGLVGTGKSSLARAIMGEIPTSGGTISVSSTSIGYCAQVPWLPSGSLKEIICGGVQSSTVDTAWYNSILEGCSLLKDLENLPHNDETQGGSRGQNLSGGQRQRVVCMISRAFSLLTKRCELGSRPLSLRPV
jgi:ATP-binding cassette, subfamily C (CFTR/MRP), member 1